MKQLINFPAINSIITRDGWSRDRHGRIMSEPDMNRKFLLLEHNPITGQDYNEYYTWDDSWYVIKDAEQPKMSYAVMIFDEYKQKYRLLSLHNSMESAVEYNEALCDMGFNFADVYPFEKHKRYLFDTINKGGKE